MPVPESHGERQTDRQTERQTDFKRCSEHPSRYPKNIINTKHTCMGASVCPNVKETKMGWRDPLTDRERQETKSERQTEILNGILSIHPNTAKYYQ